MHGQTQQSASHRVGFTLIELLVVIAIIIILVGIAVPAVMLGRTAGERAATERFMGAISMAITMYHRDHNGYPPSQIPSGTPGSSFGTPNSSMDGWFGSAIITQALMGHRSDDGQSGLGWKRGGSGLTFGPYVEPGDTEIRRGSGNQFEFQDRWDQSIRYFYAIPNKQRILGHTVSHFPTARFNQLHNEVKYASNGSLIVDSIPRLPSGIDDSHLRSARFLLASVGPTTRQSDDIFLAGP